MASQSTKRAVGQHFLPEGFVTVPASPTDLITVDTVVFQIAVGNPTNGAITFSVSDKQTVPLNPIKISIDGGSFAILPFGEGTKFLGGITWSGSGAGLVAEIFGTHIGTGTSA